MKNRILALLAGTLILTASCFDSAKEETTSQAAITSFTLGYFNVRKNDINADRRDTIIEIRDNGALYPMTIDQGNNRIYNTDSLAYGSILNSVTCLVRAFGKVYCGYEDSMDSLFYPWFPELALDFTRPLKFYAVSTDGSYIREYSFDLNVHTMDPDSMRWSGSYGTGFPSFRLKSAVSINDSVYVFGTDESGLLAVTARNVREGSWSGLTNLVGLDVTKWSGTVTTYQDRFYTICGTSLFCSHNGIDWSLCGTGLLKLFASGTETGTMYAVNTEGKIVSSEDMVTWKIVQDVPVDFPDTPAILFANTLSSNPSISRHVLAGLISNGIEKESSVWIKLSVDSVWTRQSDAQNGRLSLPAMDRLAIFSYDGSLFAFGTPFDSFWQSMDHGLTWRWCDPFADDYSTHNNFMQFPDGLKGRDLDFTYALDSYGGIWIMTCDGQVWRGAINRLNKL